MTTKGPDEMFCQECGQVISRFDRVCPKCNQKQTGPALRAPAGFMRWGFVALCSLLAVKWWLDGDRISPVIAGLGASLGIFPNSRIARRLRGEKNF